MRTDESTKWIEDAIINRTIRKFKYENFSNIQEISSGNVGKVYRANWSYCFEYFVLKSFYDLNKTTLKEIVEEIKLLRQVDYQNNVIRFFGVVKESDPKNFFLVMEYADSGTLKNYLKENFRKLTWNDKFNLAFQLAHVVSCLHSEEIVHRNLNSNNVLIHQKNIKLANLGLPERIKEASNFHSRSIEAIPYTDPMSFTRKRNKDNQIEVYLLNKKSDVYSVGVLLWEISSGRPPFDESYDIELALQISKGHRETPVNGTPDDYIKIYTDCWDVEPDNRPAMRQIVSDIAKKSQD